MITKIIKVSPGKHPEIKDTASFIEFFQKEVNGEFAEKPITNKARNNNSLFLFYNRNSKKIGLPGNRIFNGEIIAGDFLISEFNSKGDLVNLSEENEKFYMELFYEPDIIDKVKLPEIAFDDEYVYFEKGDENGN